ncbi:MAG: nitronate monooxygenase [Spirochaetota bacterium]|nr:nitronate monooxygenase [Spirochaetota bacterium]
MIKTELCDMLGIKYPIIQAGMGPWKTEKLSIAAANAGILGIISTSGILAESFGMPGAEGSSDKVNEEIDNPRKMIKKLIHNVEEQTRDSKGVFGINCMVSMEMFEGSKEVLEGTIESINENPSLKERLKVVITSAGDPIPCADIIKPSGLKWFHVVPSVRHAKRCQKAGVDAVIASGHEAGGHTAWQPVHSMVLLPAIVRAVDIPVIGAGGFCDGTTLVAALVLGACGVQMGTRFIATEESDFVQIWKDRVLKSSEMDTIASRGFVGPLRYLKNNASVELTELTIKNTPQLFIGEPDDTLDPEIFEFESKGMSALLGDDDEKALFFGGEAAGRVDDIPPIKELLDRIEREAEELISSIPRFVQTN